jgi:pSer/pThr/pTyr-binding forkhead associated (FHA) protein
MPQFIIKDKGQPPRTFKFTALPFVIGRGEDVAVVLPNISVSRMHAEVTRVGPHYEIRDLGSQNGLYVNGKEAKEWRLKHGDQIQVGKYVLTFHDEAMAANRVEAGPSPDILPIYRIAAGTVSEDQTFAISAADLQRQNNTNLLREGARVISDSRERQQWQPGEKGLLFGGAGNVQLEGVLWWGVSASISWSGTHHVLKRASWFQPVEVNGKNVSEHVLKPGDSFRLGRSRFRYQGPGAP